MATRFRRCNAAPTSNCAANNKVKERIEQAGKGVCGSLAAQLRFPRDRSVTPRKRTPSSSSRYIGHRTAGISSPQLAKRSGTTPAIVCHGKGRSAGLAGTEERPLGSAKERSTLCSQLPVTTCNNLLSSQHFHVRIRRTFVLICR